MEAEQSQNFNERLSQWVANQGFWFQVRYSMTGSGTKGTAVFHLLRMGFRLLIFLLVAAVAGWIYLVKRVDRPGFVEEIRTALQTGLSGSDSEMRGFTQIQGQLGISRFACEGGDETFFSSLEARNIHCKMGLFDGLGGLWDPGVIAISKLDMELRAGADDAESSKKISKAIFKQFPNLVINNFEVGDATLRWGYSERTRGEIVGSVLKVIRSEATIKMIFHGGTFSQNWLDQLEIVNLVVVCDQEGIAFEKAEFRRGGGSVDFSGLKVDGGERPMVKGTAKIRNISLEHVLPSALRSFVEGSLSGDFQVFGSTNSLDGIGLMGQVTLDGQDTISLRERLPLLKALSVVDYSRNYHRVDFREGLFQLKTGRGGLEVTGLKLKADELFTLEGSMLVRLPTPEETQTAIETNAKGGAPTFNSEDAEFEPKQKAESDDFTLRRAALEAKRVKEGKQSEQSLSLIDRLGLGQDMRHLEAQAADRMSRMLRYEGNFRITLPPDAFERTPRLAEQFPMDMSVHRIPMMVKIEGSLYELTLKQAEEVYQLGQQNRR